MCSTRNMTEKVRNITVEEYELSIYKHKSWELLNNYINKLEEIEEKYPESASYWLSEFFNCETKNELRHFMGYFEKKFELLLNVDK